MLGQRVRIALGGRGEGREARGYEGSNLWELAGAVGSVRGEDCICRLYVFKKNCSSGQCSHSSKRAPSSTLDT